jgi:hypothetical protein
MSDINQNNLTNETIHLLGLRQTNRPINAQIAPNARVFEYPHMDGVYIMESDLYGNTMPEGCCFLAFEGRAGLMGKHITIDALINSSVEDVRKMVEVHHSG